MDIRTQNARDKQVLRDLEWRYQDLQRIRRRDQEIAQNVEASLRERLRLEELEWQRLVCPLLPILLPCLLIPVRTLSFYFYQ